MVLCRFVIHSPQPSLNSPDSWIHGPPYVYQYIRLSLGYAARILGSIVLQKWYFCWLFFCSRLQRGDWGYSKLFFWMFSSSFLSRLRRGYVRAFGKAILGTLMFLTFSYSECVRAFGDAILGTVTDLSEVFSNIFFSRLRRGDFRYTEISLCRVPSYFVRATGETISGTLAYLSVFKCLELKYSSLLKGLRQDIKTR